MGRSLPELSLKEKVLLWMRHVRDTGGDEAGLASTQVGIADATGLSRGHVSRTVAPLLEGRLLVEAPRRVSGFSRVLKGYDLGPDGGEAADRLAEVLLECDIEVRRAGVAAEQVPLRDVVGRQWAGVGLWPALRQVWSNGFVDRESTPAPGGVQFRFLREMADAPEPSAFVGRDDEVTAIETWMRGPGSLLVVEGHGGVGKTTLVGHVIRRVDPRRHVLWVRVTDWLSGHDLVARLDATLERLGHPPRSHPPEEPSLIADHLGARTRHLPLLVVLDDVQKSPQRLAATIPGIVRAARVGPAFKVVLIGRRVPLPPDLARESTLLRLGPLPPSDADRLLAGHGVATTRRPELVATAQGNPLFLELLARGREGGNGALSVADYVARDLAADLPEEHRELLDWCSALRTPVPASLWQRLGVGSAAALDDLAEASLLKRRDDGRLEMHDLVRDAFYARLPFEAKRRIHARLASAFSPAARGMGDVAEFLHHLVRAGRREEAARWVLRNRTRLMDQAHRMFQAPPR